MSADLTRRIVVLRHAKSDHPLGTADHDRPLAERGQRDAKAAGRWLADRGITLDLCLCSTATRTRQTWECAAGELPQQPATVYEDRIYDASYAELVALLRETPEDVGTVLVIGHNPGMHALADTLAGGLVDHFPTSAIAVISFGGSWRDVEDGVGTLDEVWTPRESATR